jgi:hypothetical protein
MDAATMRRENSFTRKLQSGKDRASRGKLGAIDHERIAAA